MAGATILWLRSDLRLDDNAALDKAVAHRAPIVPLFIHAPHQDGSWAPGAASRWWLDRSLRALESSLGELGSRLVVRQGDTLDVLRAVARETRATAVVWSRRYEPAVVERDTELKSALRADGLEATSHNSSLLLEPWQNRKADGTPYRVFTPFWTALRRHRDLAPPCTRPVALPSPASWPAGESIDDLRLLPRIDWTAGMREAWTPGEKGATDALGRFVESAMAAYPTARDAPARAGTSRLSPHLHFGEIGPRRIWKAVRDLVDERGDGAFDAAAESWLRQLGWREFAHHLLFHFPHTTDSPLRSEFARMRRRESREDLRAWQKGLTGYPIVDAGMRELWTTGWMHNRVRMIVASFLVKDLRIPWQEGARWFWDTLVDADLANNTMGWQWTAGCGADAAPYFRVFNPLLQSRKFDPQGAYIRRWVPELAALDDRRIHDPSNAPPVVLEKAGVRIGSDYPAPIVAHGEARHLALEAYDAMTGEG